MVDKINSTKMIFFSDKQQEVEIEKDSRWTDVLFCIVTDAV